MGSMFTKYIGPNTIASKLNANIPIAAACCPAIRVARHAAPPNMAVVIPRSLSRVFLKALFVFYAM